MNDSNTIVSKNLIDYCINPCNIAKLKKLDRQECRQILPFLSRIWIRNTFFDEINFSSYKLAILEKLKDYTDTNQIEAYLRVDFAQIYDDIIKHLSTRKKTQTLSCYTCTEFESATPTGKLLMVSNILLNGNIRSEENINCKYSAIDYSLFDYEIYFQDLSDLLCICHAELGEVVSLSQFVFTLLHTHSSMCVNYILNLIANSVDSVFQIVDIILEGCSCSQIDVQRHKCLLAIASCWPSLISYIINECIRRHCLPSVILFLARQENLISTLLSIFQFEYDRNWFVQFLRSPNKNLIEKQSVDVIREDLILACYKSKSTPHLDLQLFRLYSALRIYAGLKFNEAEVKSLVELILNTNEISVATCFLLIYSPLYETDGNSQRIVQWLRDKFNQAQQSLLLLAIYCNSHQLNLINDYTSGLIGFRAQIKSVSLSSMSRIFQQVFPDDMLVNEYMRNLPIINNLNAKLMHNSSNSSKDNKSSLGIYFLNQWIKTNSFLNKRSLELNNWLFEQIKQCSAPLHPIMISLINTYITQLFNVNVLNDYRLEPLSAQLILDFFQNNYSDYDSHICVKILLFYYLLTHETKRRETLLQTTASIQNQANQQQQNSKLYNSDLFTFRYSSEIFEYIPINYLLLKAKQSEYLILYPALLRLVINLFTQLCQVEHCLFEEKFSNPKWKELQFIIFKLDEIKQSIHSGQLTRNQAKMFKKNWLKAYSIHGRKLSLKTLSTLMNLPKLKYDEIYSNPLILLKSEDLEIYKCGSLLEILLYILRECLMANKNQMENFIIENHLSILNEAKTNPYSVIKTIKDRQELKNSLIAAQDTGVIQILLDLYLLIEKKSNELVTRDIQCIICSFIHQMFIENSNLAELVHFQGYPKQLIPILVRGVPSMHICIDFVPKLLSHSDLNKQIFAINLISALCQKYPIVRTYNVAKLAINSISTLLQALTYEQRKSFFEQIAPAIVVFYTKLPPLTQECMSLIIHAIQTKSIEVENLPDLINVEL